MNSKELRGLTEAYIGVYALQENIDEGLRSAVKRLLGGGKKEAEAPKPESRGEQLRKKYNVGPEKSDTSAKRQILNRSRARAERDEKEFGDSKYSKSVAQKSKAAHERYLKAGYSKYGADDARGSGNKARKRAAALNREEFEFIVNSLIEEGYDLSSYTYDEMYEICLDEAVKGQDTEMRRVAAVERKSGDRLLPAKEGEKYADFKKAQVAYVKRKRMGEEIEQIDEITADLGLRAVKAADKKRAELARSGDKEGAAAKAAQAKRLYVKQAKIRLNREDFDIFDTVLEFLQAEGYAETLEEAEWMMANVIDEEAIDIILGEEQLDELSNRTVSNALNARIAATGAASDRAYKHRNPEAMRAAETAASKEAGMRSAVAKRRARMNKEEYMDEAQAARENPEKYEREQSKKYAPVRGERTPMPPRGDKRREDFEKWYAKQMGR